MKNDESTVIGATADDAKDDVKLVLPIAISPSVAIPIQEDDVIAATDQAIRDLTIKYIEEVLRLSTGLIQHGNKAATRGLHLTEGLASIQGHVFRLLGMAKRPKRHRNNPYTMMSSVGSSYSALDDFDGDDPEEATGDALGETFGTKALKQLIAMAKPLLMQGGLLGMASNTKANQKGAEIESLTKALAEANEAKLDPVICVAIRDKLKLALASEMLVPVPQLEVPIMVSPIDAPPFVCGAKEGA